MTPSGPSLSGCDSSNRPAPLTLEGGAPEHALFVDADGDLGLGTNVPQTDVHMRSGNTPTLRLDQDSSEHSIQTGQSFGVDYILFSASGSRPQFGEPAFFCALSRPGNPDGERLARISGMTKS